MIKASTSGFWLKSSTAFSKSLCVAPAGMPTWKELIPTRLQVSCFLLTYLALGPSSPTRMVPRPGVTPCSFKVLTLAATSCKTASATTLPSSSFAGIRTPCSILRILCERCAQCKLHSRKTFLSSSRDQGVVSGFDGSLAARPANGKKSKLMSLATVCILENKERAMRGRVKIRRTQPHEGTYSQAAAAGDRDHGTE